jgi:hypothetical protein
MYYIVLYCNVLFVCIDRLGLYAMMLIQLATTWYYVLYCAVEASTETMHEGHRLGMYALLMYVCFMLGVIPPGNDCCSRNISDNDCSHFLVYVCCRSICSFFVAEKYILTNSKSILAACGTASPLSSHPSMHHASCIH